MSDNYKFYQHTKCEYFPCHGVKNVDEFNCLFCYCPLYFIKECGGNNTWIKGIKVCTYCTIPHLETGYDIIVNKIKARNKENKL
jgi:Zn-finger protein